MYRIDILISGNGSLLPPLFEAVQHGEIDAVIGSVISDRPEAPGLERARQANVPTLCLDRREYRRRNSGSLSDAILEQLGGKSDLIVLAGFLSILEGKILEEFAGRIINIHPALLPAHGGRGMYGIRVHEAVVADGDRESGCTVHFVTAGIDRGPVILQRRIALAPGDTPADVQRKVHQVEGPALLEAIKKVMTQKRSTEGAYA